MIIVPEKVIPNLIGRTTSFKAVEAVFAAMSNGDAYNFPVIRENIGYADALYGFKSGFDKVGLSLGLKPGGYWPGNESKGLTNHQSTIFLFDADSGKVKAMVGGNYLTAMRTAGLVVGFNQTPRPRRCQNFGHVRCWASISFSVAGRSRATKI